MQGISSNIWNTFNLSNCDKETEEMIFILKQRDNLCVFYFVDSSNSIESSPICATSSLIDRFYFINCARVRLLLLRTHGGVSVIWRYCVSVLCFFFRGKYFECWEKMTNSVPDRWVNLCLLQSKSPIARGVRNRPRTRDRERGHVTERLCHTNFSSHLEPVSRATMLLR